MRIKDLLILQRVGRNLYRSALPDAATILNYESDARGPLVYGGHTVAQSILAAIKTLPGNEWIPASYSGYFLRAGDIRLPIDYSVQSIGHSEHAGRTLLIVEAAQKDKLLTRATVSLEERKQQVNGCKDNTVPSCSPQCDVDMDSVAPPERLLEAGEIRRRARAAGVDTRRLDDSWKTFHMRPVNQSAEAMLRPAPATELWWLRAPKHDSHSYESEAARRVVLAYMSDVLMQIIVRMHVHERRTLAGFHASLDHQIWWHGRSCPVADWLLYHVRSPIACSFLSYTRRTAKIGTAAVAVALSVCVLCVCCCRRSCALGRARRALKQRMAENRQHAVWNTSMTRVQMASRSSAPPVSAP